MRQIEVDFLDEYKRVDSICSDMYSCKAGVSEYISRMEQLSSRYSWKLSSWNSDYHALKRFRWLRNQISHNINGSDCSLEDFNSLYSFHQRLLRQQDPLSLMRCADAAAYAPYHTSSTKDTHSYHPPRNQKPPSEKDSASFSGKVAIFLVVLAFIMLFLLLNASIFFTS